MFSRTNNKVAKEFAGIERELAALNAKRASLLERLSAAEATVISKREAATKAALEDASNALDQAEIAMRAAQDRVASLSSARNQIDLEVSNAEQRLAQAKDAAQRADFVAHVDKLEAAINAALPTFLEHAATLSTAIDSAGRLVFEARQLAIFLDSCRADIPKAIHAVKATLTHLRQNVSDGGGIPDAVEPPAPTPPPPPPVETKAVFLIHPVRFMEGAGFIRAFAAPNDVMLPVKLAERALQCGAALPLDHPKAKALMGERNYGMPNSLAECVDLDQEEPTLPKPPTPQLIRRRQ
jgi:multidrug efflux pump subunit AcrA (membrane-fusion protein)